MTGISQYTEGQIRFILVRLVHGQPVKDLRAGFEARFGRELTQNQVRYIKNKYGRDSRYE